MKKRLDLYLLEKYPQYSRRQIQTWITEGSVTVGGTVKKKAGEKVNTDAAIVLSAQEPKYVSRAGFKLEKALEHFNIDVTDLTSIDSGLSTGGFTDCLLQHGVKKVFGIDVGTNQVHNQINNNPRVIVMEKTNLKTVTGA